MDDRRLDELLDAWRVEPATMALRDAVMATAPRRGAARVRLPAFGLELSGVRLWLAGAGVAAGLAGVSCGAVLSTVAVREAQDEALVASAVSEGSTAATLYPEPARTR
jgi:hypothetical protein